MGLDNINQLVFEFFESRSDLKSKFYDSLHRLIFDKESTHLKNLLISYESQIIDFEKRKNKKTTEKEKE
jgi:hypothetical protein